MEKQSTTPDAYPLSLNSLRLACNQSTNRDPVVDYDEDVVREAPAARRRGLARLASGAEPRREVPPPARRAPADDDRERAVICALMLRGAQTPGELKQRTERMHAFADLDAVHGTLQACPTASSCGAAPPAGQKEKRYAQLLGEEDARGGLAGACRRSRAARRGARG